MTLALGWTKVLALCWVVNCWYEKQVAIEGLVWEPASWLVQAKAQKSQKRNPQRQVCGADWAVQAVKAGRTTGCW